jgi:integrase
MTAKAVRPRKKDRHLPPCVYIKHAAYWYVKAGKWTRLGADLPSALREYARLASDTKSGMDGLINRWLESISDKVSANTLSAYTQAAKRVKTVFSEFEPGQIKPRDVAEWMAHESKCPSRANIMRTVLKLALDKAVLMGLADSNPVIYVKKAVENERTRYITDAEYRAIHTHASPELRAIMDLCYYTGQRISDVLGIKLADLTDAGIAVRQQKTKARLIIGWTPELRAIIADCKGMGGNVRGMHLLCYNGAPLKYPTIWKQWNKARKAAGVDDAHIHDIRAKALTDATRQGLNAQALAGHATQAMTDHYVKQRDVPVVQSPKFGTGF